MKFRLVEQLSVRNVPSLKRLALLTKSQNKSVPTQIFGDLSSIKELEMRAAFSNLNIHDLVGLERLKLSGLIEKNNFNFGMLNNVCNHLQELTINIRNINEEMISKLFYGRYFPHLVKLIVKFSNELSKLGNSMFYGFPMLQTLIITNNRRLRLIENDAFSNLTNLIHLDLSGNGIDPINQNFFSQLINLKSLNLKDNRILTIEENSFSNLNNLTNLDLSFNYLSRLNPQSLNGLENLKRINLRHTWFDFDIRFLDYIPNVKHVNLVKNNYTTKKEELSSTFKHIKFHF